MPSMKNILDELPLKKRQALVHLFETDDYAVLKEVIQLLRTNAGISTLDAQTWDDVKHLQGQAFGLKQLHLNLKELHKKMSKD